MEIIKIAIGGLLAFPIAYLMVLWFFGQDPLQIGPVIGNIAPFVVPAELRGPEPEPAPAKTEIKTNEPLEDNGALPIPDIDPDKVRANEIE